MLNINDALCYLKDVVDKLNLISFYVHVLKNFTTHLTIQINFILTRHLGKECITHECIDLVIALATLGKRCHYTVLVPLPSERRPLLFCFPHGGQRLTKVTPTLSPPRPEVLGKLLQK